MITDEAALQAFLPLVHPPSVVIAQIVDQENRAYSLFLGEFHAVWSARPTIGRDSSNLLILDVDGVPSVACRLSGQSNHRYVEWLDRPGNRMQRVDSSAFQVGPITVQLVEQVYKGQELPGSSTQDGRFSVGSGAQTPRLPDKQVPTDAMKAAWRYAKSLANVRWLVPDADMERLAPAAIDWLHERFDEVQSAIKRPPLKADAIHFVRSLPRAWRHYHHRWSTVDVYQDEGANDGLRELTTTTPLGGSRFRATEMLRGVLGANPTAQSALRALQSPGHGPWIDRAVRAVSAVLEGAQSDPSLLLVDMFRRGVWPVPLPYNSWCVYVPVWRGNQIVRDPGPEIEPEPDIDGPEIHFDTKFPVGKSSAATHYPLRTVFFGSSTA